MDAEWNDAVGREIAPGAVIADKYRVVRIIGTGGMGAVLEAWHLQLDERVALKVLRPELVTIPEMKARFEREARAAFKIRSEHVVRVIDVSALPSGAPFMVLEYLDGHDLANAIETEGRMDPKLAVEYVLQAIEAIAEGHKLGIVHRDLKPENIFITTRSDGTAWIKVLDFGLSKLKSAGDEGVDTMAGLTGDEASIGTPLYMSPEQWASSAHVGVGTDIWALGVILFELLTGHVPFDGESMSDVYSNILADSVPTFDSFGVTSPPGLEGIVRRCLELDEEDRYPNVAELATCLSVYSGTRGRLSADRITGTLDVELGPLVREIAGATAEESAPTQREPEVMPLAATIGMSDEPSAALATTAYGEPLTMDSVEIEPPEQSTRRMTRVREPEPEPARRSSLGWVLVPLGVLVVAGSLAGFLVMRQESEPDPPKIAKPAMPEPTVAAETTTAPAPAAAPTPETTAKPTEPEPPKPPPVVTRPPSQPQLRPPPPPPPIAPRPKSKDERIKDALDTR